MCSDQNRIMTSWLLDQCSTLSHTSQARYFIRTLRKRTIIWCKHAKNILKSIKFQKPALLFILSYLLSHDHLQLRGRVPCHTVWSCFSIVAKLCICHQPGIQYVPTKLFLILLCAHLHYCLRSYIKWESYRFLQLFINTLIYNIELTNVKAHISPLPQVLPGFFLLQDVPFPVPHHPVLQ